MADFGDLEALVAVVLGVSLATERIVAIAKTVAPPLESVGAPPRSEPVRRLLVQAIALAGAWLTAALLAWSAVPGLSFMGALFSHVPAGTAQIPVPLVGLLASGGSAFWAQVVQYVSAVKDITVLRQREVALASPLGEGRASGHLARAHRAAASGA